MWAAQHRRPVDSHQRAEPRGPAALHLPDVHQEHQEPDGGQVHGGALCPRRRGEDQAAGDQVPAWIQRSEWSDLQSPAWRHCGKGWCSCGSSHHRDKQPECGGCAPREDRQLAGHISGRDPHEDDAHVHVPPAHWSGESHIYLSLRENNKRRLLLTIKKPYKDITILSIYTYSYRKIDRERVNICMYMRVYLYIYIY